MPSLVANNLRITYEVQGSGPPLLLITGLGYGGWFWHRVAPSLSRCFQVITFDNRGAGGTDKPAGPYTVAMLAADTAGLLDALGLSGICVLGHSLGGFVAQELALARPDLVSRLILAATHPGGPNAIPMKPEVIALLTDRSGTPIDLFRRGIAIATAPGFAEDHPAELQQLLAYRMSNPVPPAQYTAQALAGMAMGSLTEEQVAERLGRIGVPTLILCGEQDRVVSPANAQLFLDAMAQASARIMPGVGHLFPLEHPEATTTAISEFFRPAAR